MSDLDTIRRRTRSAEDMQTVVRTVKTMAAVNIRQYEAAVESLTEFTSTIQSGIAMLLQHADVPQSSNVHERSGAVVFGSDQGMCGQFNESIASFATEWSEEHFASPISFAAPPICVGHRAATALLNRGVEPVETMRLPGAATAITKSAHDLLPVIDEWRQSHSLDRVVLFHNRRRSASQTVPHARQLVPIRFDRLIRRVEKYGRGETSRCLPWWSIEIHKLFSSLIRQHLFSALFLSIAESLSAENASRIAAMQSAERSIRERLSELHSDFSQQRQNVITSELLDVVGGFVALSEQT